jgi:hypothetical protein
MRINSDPLPAPAPMPQVPQVQVTESPVPQAPALGPGISIDQVIQVLGVVENLQPGITVKQLTESLQKNPEAIQRLIAVYMGAIKK